MTAIAGADLLAGLLEAVWLVDAVSLRVVSANAAAAGMSGLELTDLIHRPIVELFAAPEDYFFWEDAASGIEHEIHSETWVRSADGDVIPVERRVQRVRSDSGAALFLVTTRDMRAQRQAEDERDRTVAELRATLESTADGILVTDLDGSVRSYNRIFAELWSVPEALLITPDDKALYAHMASCLDDDSLFDARVQHVLQDPLTPTGGMVTLRSGRKLEHVTMPQFSRGAPTGRVVSFRDVTQRLTAESGLRLAAKVFASSLDAVFITDPGFLVLTVNPRCDSLTGLTPEALLGADARSLFFDPNEPEFFQQIELKLQSENAWQGQLWRKVPGRPECAYQVTWVVLRDTNQHVQHSIAFCKDLTESLAAQRRIEELAYSDALTGLPNRLLLAQRVEFALRVAKRTRGRFAILFLDLDRFKNINDSMGHAFGDQVLLEVARRIKSCLRDVDTLCRVGGDEFVVFLQECNAIGAEIVANRMLELLANSFAIHGTQLSVGSSIGIALYPQDGHTLDDLVKCADVAMYRVKERGRGSFRFYQAQMNVDLLSRMKMDHAMRLALDEGRFKLNYQPVVCIRSGQIVGAEALLRWHDPQLGQVSPSVFIGLAEESGFIVRMGNWVLQEAVRQAARWCGAGIGMTVAINVSALQFQQADFVQRVADALAREGLPASRIELELTESILVKDANEALSRLHALAALGIGLAIDDFGTGYSSLSYLKKFPISKLKIDRSFVTGLPDDEGDRAIVSATIGMAKALKLTVVAEGVETPEQHAFLAGLDCDCFQGFLCAPAMPAPEFEVLYVNPRLVDVH